MRTDFDAGREHGLSREPELAFDYPDFDSADDHFAPDDFGADDLDQVDYDAGDFGDGFAPDGAGPDDDGDSFESGGYVLDEEAGYGRRDQRHAPSRYRGEARPAGQRAGRGFESGPELKARPEFAPGAGRTATDSSPRGRWTATEVGPRAGRPSPRSAGNSADDHRSRTQTLVSHGRGGRSGGGTAAGTWRRLKRQFDRLSRQHKIALGAAVAAALVTFSVVSLTGGGASWPDSVATVQTEAARACQNPDVRSEPGQVDFACATSTSAILWVFALITSHDDAHFADRSTGRQGLEPITPAQGGEVAWSLNLHRPYQPDNPVDSLEVAARAINDIIGGATVTASDGKTEVQAGLESTAAGCTRYTGSAALRSRAGYPSVCAHPLTPVGQANLVEDVFAKWIVGASPAISHDAGVLFAHASDPGSPQVQAILRHLDRSKSPA